MAWHPVKIDDSVTRTGGGSVHVGQGQYLLQLAAITPSKEDYEGEPHFRFELIFLEGPDPMAKGQRISYVATFKADAQFGFGTILEAFGGIKVTQLVNQEFASYAKWVALANKLCPAEGDGGLKGKKVGGTVIDNNYNGRISSRVDKVWSASEWDARKSAVISVPTSAVPIAASTNGTNTNSEPSADFLSEVDSLFS